MARRVFFSFHYQRDVWRINQIRNLHEIVGCAAAGFQGVGGIFRLLPDGTNQRGLAVATIQNRQVVVIDPAPTSFGAAGT